MGPAGSDRVSRDRPYSGIWIKSPTVFVYRAVTFCGASFHSLRLTIRFVTLRLAGRRITPNPTTPERQRLPSSLHSGLGYSHFARHYSGNRGFFPFLGLLRCFSSPAYLACPMYSDKRTRALPRVGFPIRTSRDQRLVSTYSGHLAAAHVLHRLLAPRHPPCALILLISTKTPCMPLWSFQGARGYQPQSGRPRAVSQNSAALETSWSTLFQASRTTGRPLHDPVVPSTGSAPTGVIAPASLERR